MTVDPVRDGTNWYQYCLSDPVNLWDPLGLCDESGRSINYYESGYTYKKKWPQQNHLFGNVKVLSETLVSVTTNAKAPLVIASDKSVSYSHNDFKMEVNRDGEMTLTDSKGSLTFGENYSFTSQVEVNVSAVIESKSEGFLKAEVKHENIYQLLSETSVDGYVPVGRTTVTVSDKDEIINIANVTEARMRPEDRDLVIAMEGMAILGPVIGPIIGRVLSGSSGVVVAN